MPGKWVTIRSKWTVDAAFEALARAVEEDVSEIKGLSEEERLGRTYKFEKRSDSGFIVFRSRNSERGAELSRLYFDKKQFSLSVTRRDGVDGKRTGEIVTAIPRLAVRGECSHLWVGEEPFTVEELSRHILQDFFFGPWEAEEKPRAGLAEEAPDKD